MLMNIIIFKNIKIDAFTTPQFIDNDPDKAAIQLRRSLILSNDMNIINQYKDLQMYYLGEFDDQVGTIKSDGAKLLLDCSQVISEKMKEGKEDGSEEKEN